MCGCYCALVTKPNGPAASQASTCGGLPSVRPACQLVSAFRCGPSRYAVAVAFAGPLLRCHDGLFHSDGARKAALSDRVVVHCFLLPVAATEPLDQTFIKFALVALVARRTFSWSVG